MNIIQPIDSEVALTQIQVYLRDLQNRVCAVIEAEDGQAKFQEDPWQHPGGGGGLTRSLSGGRYIEKAGVNFSHVQGTQLPQAATHKRPQLENASMQFQ